MWEVQDYSDQQLKIINKGIYLTDDKWNNAKVGIGEIEYNNTKYYGVNAEILIGNIIMGNELHILDNQGREIFTVVDGKIHSQIQDNNANYVDGHIADSAASVKSYADTQITQTADRISLEASSKLEAVAGYVSKNLICPSLHTSISSNVSGVTLTDDTGTVAFSVSSGAWQGISWSNLGLIIGHTYILTFKNNKANSYGQVGLRKKSDSTFVTSVSLSTTGNKSLEFTYSVEGFISILGSNASDVGSVNISHLMIRDKNVSDATFEPYCNSLQTQIADTNSRITQTADSITLEVNKKVNTTDLQANYSTTEQMNSKISQTADKITSEANARLEATVGYSSKNVLAITANTLTDDGLTFTVNKEAGTVKVNGTCTAENYKTFVVGTVTNTGSGDVKYYLSGCANGGASDKYYLYAIDSTTGNRPKQWDGITTSLSSYNLSDQVEILIPSGNTVQIRILVRNGQTLNNLVFKPMVRDGSISDKTFEPYKSIQTQITDTNSRITQTADSITSEVSKRIKATVGHSDDNLFVYNKSTQTINGITFTIDKEAETIKASGTATADAIIYFTIPSTVYGNLYFSGCPDGGSSSTWDVYCWDDTASARPKKWDGTTSSASCYNKNQAEEIKLVNGHTSVLAIRIRSGKTVNNLVFEPSITKNKSLQADVYETNSKITQTADSITLQVNENLNRAASSDAIEYKMPTDITINYYGYGLTNTTTTDTGRKASDNNGKYYLDRKTGKVYKSNGSTWVINRTLPQKFDDYYTSSQANAAIEVSAQSIKQTVGSSTSKYDTTGYTIDYYGLDLPAAAGYPASENNGKYYLNQSTGFVYKSNGTTWSKQNSTALPLISKQLDSKIDQTADSITSEVKGRFSATVGHSSKNLFEITTSTITQNGLTFTVNESAGTITVNGTSTATTIIGIGTIKSVGNYLLSGGANGGSSEKYYLYAYDGTEEAICKKWDGVTDSQRLYDTSTTEVKLISGHENAVRILIRSDQTLNNVVFKPMVRNRVFENDDSFEPYYAPIQTQITDTNSRITQTAGSITSEVNKKVNTTDLQANYSTTEQMNSKISQTAGEIAMSVTKSTLGYSGKNLLKITGTTTTVNGIKFTVNKSAGTVTATGTATANATFAIARGTDLPTGDLYLSGGGSSGSTATYYVYAYDYTVDARPKKWDGTTQSESSINTASNVEVKLVSGHYTAIRIMVREGVTVNGKVFKPMLRYGNIVDSTFEPWVDNGAKICSQISMTDEQISLTSGRLLITSGNFKLDSSGTATMTNAVLTGGTIKTSNYAAASGSTKTVGGKLNLSATGSTLLFDTANFKITGAGAVTATSATLNSCSIVGGTFKVTTTESETSLIELKATGSCSTTISPQYINLEDSSGFGYSARISFGEVVISEGAMSTIITGVGVRTTALTGTNVIGQQYHVLGSNGTTEYGVMAQMSTYSGNDILALGMSEYPLRFACTEAYIDGYLNFYKYNSSAMDYGGITFGSKIALRYWASNESFCVGISDKKLQFYGTNVLMPNGSAVTSDARKKNHIEPLDGRYLDVIKNIEPSRFKYNDNPEDRYHTGYIAQNVLLAAKKCGISIDEFAAFVDVNNDGSDLALRYGEFIPLLHKWIKELDERINALEKKGKE